MSARVHILIEQGATFAAAFGLVDEANDPVDLTPYDGSCQIRKHWASANSAANVSVSLASNGIMTLSLTANQTATMTGGRYVYDVILTDQSNNRIRLIEGTATVTPSVTR